MCCQFSTYSRCTEFPISMFAVFTSLLCDHPLRSLSAGTVMEIRKQSAYQIVLRNISVFIKKGIIQKKESDDSNSFLIYYSLNISSNQQSRRQHNR